MSDMLRPQCLLSSPHFPQFLLHISPTSRPLHNPQENRRDGEIFQQVGPLFPLCKKIGWGVSMPLRHSDLDRHNRHSILAFMDFNINGINRLEIELQRYVISRWHVLQKRYDVRVECRYFRWTNLVIIAPTQAT